MSGANEVLKEESLEGIGSSIGLQSIKQGNTPMQSSPLCYKNILLLCLVATLGCPVGALLNTLLPVGYELLFNDLSLADKAVKGELLNYVIRLFSSYRLLFIFAIFYLYFSSRRIDVLRKRVFVSSFLSALFLVACADRANSSLVRILLKNNFKVFLPYAITVISSLLLIVLMVIVFKILDLVNKQIIDNKTLTKPFSRRESKLILVAFIGVILFLISDKVFFYNTSRLFVDAGVAGEHGRFQGVLIHLTVGGALLLNVLCSYWLTPSSVKELTFNRTPQIFSSLLSMLFALLILSLLFALLAYSAFVIINIANSVLWLNWVFLAATIFFIIEGLKIFSPTAFVMLLLVTLPIIYLVLSANAEGARVFQYHTTLNEYIFMILSVFSVSLLAFWGGTGSLQLGIHRLYEKGSDDYDASKQQFYKSWFARIFNPLVRWL